MGQSLSSALWEALGIGSMLMIISSVTILIGMAVTHGRKALRDIENALHDLDFSGIFVEVDPDEID